MIKGDYKHRAKTSAVWCFDSSVLLAVSSSALLSILLLSCSLALLSLSCKEKARLQESCDRAL